MLINVYMYCYREKFGRMEINNYQIDGRQMLKLFFYIIIYLL